MLTFLFSFFVESAKVEKKIDAARVEIASRQRLQMRLQSLFTSLKRGNFQPTFYTKIFPEEENASLITLFDNGIDPDPAFSGAVLSRIYLDEENNLSLVLWPVEKEKTRPWRKEILLSNVTSFSFEFMKASPLGWQPNWQKSPEIPSLIRLTVRTSQKEPLKFAFILPSAEPMPTYFPAGRKA